MNMRNPPEYCLGYLMIDIQFKLEMSITAKEKNMDQSDFQARRVKHTNRSLNYKLENKLSLMSRMSHVSDLHPL